MWVDPTELQITFTFLNVCSNNISTFERSAIHPFQLRHLRMKINWPEEQFDQMWRFFLLCFQSLISWGKKDEWKLGRISAYALIKFNFILYDGYAALDSNIFSWFSSFFKIFRIRIQALETAGSHTTTGLLPLPPSSSQAVNVEWWWYSYCHEQAKICSGLDDGEPL